MLCYPPLFVFDMFLHIISCTIASGKRAQSEAWYQSLRSITFTALMIFVFGYFNFQSFFALILVWEVASFLEHLWQTFAAWKQEVLPAN
jgi:hypothetical protein